MKFQFSAWALRAICGLLWVGALFAAQTYNSNSGRSYGQSGPVLSAASGSISGGLTLGTCNTATVNVPGATTSMAAIVSPASGTSMANGIQWQAQVTSANTVTVWECGLLIVTPTATTFNVRVIP
jgi:hypothetical protein